MLILILSQLFPSFAVALFIVPGESSSELSTIREPACRKSVGEFLKPFFFSFGWWNAIFSVAGSVRVRLIVSGSVPTVEKELWLILQVPKI
jgi:hypothetical protein